MAMPTPTEKALLAAEMWSGRPHQDRNGKKRRKSEGKGKKEGSNEEGGEDGEDMLGTLRCRLELTLYLHLDCDCLSCDVMLRTQKSK